MSAFIDEHRARFGVEPICRTLGVSASAYYRARQRPALRPRSSRTSGCSTGSASCTRRNYYAYGSRRMWKALLRAGEQVGRGRVERLMRQNGIQGAKRRGKPWRTTIADPAAQRRPDLVERDFSAAGRDELWFADFTYLRCWEGLVFFRSCRRLQPRGRRLAVRSAHAHRPRPRRAADGARPRERGRRCRARPPQRRRQPVHLLRLQPDPRRPPACSPRSDRSATPTTTRSPRASSTASRPN